MTDNHRNESIHPRMLYRVEDRRKLNTCMPASRRKLERAIAGTERHLAKHLGDAAGFSRLANLKARLAAIPQSQKRAA